jgi:hypothetical protein
MIVIRKDSNSRIVAESNDAANEWVSILIDECNRIWCKTLSFSSGIRKILNMWNFSSVCRRSVVALHLITVSVEMGFSKLSLIQPKTSHVHVCIYSVSHSVICKPFIGEKLYICQARVVIDLHNEDLTTLCDLRVSPPCLLLLLEIDLSLWRHVWSLVEECDPGLEKVWPAMTMLPHLTAQTQFTTTEEHHQTHLC